MKDDKKNNKEKILNIFLLLLLGFLYVISIMNICTYLFGSERELYIEEERQNDGDLRYYIYYNNGEKMVNERVHLSFIEIIQKNNNSGYIPFKQLATQLTHRSAFVYSSIYFIIVSVGIVFYIICKKNINIRKIKF